MGIGRRDDSVLLIAAALGGIAGLRSLAAPALLTHEVAEGDVNGGRGRLHDALSSEGLSRLVAVLAAGEMLADKTPYVGNRTDFVPLLGRAAIGSFTAAAYAMEKRHPPLLAAAVGAATAIGATFAGFHLRRYASEQFRVPDRVLGALEDALVLGATGTLSEVLEDIG